MSKTHFVTVLCAAVFALHGCSPDNGPTAQVTVEPGFDNFLRVLAKNPADSGLNKAINEAVSAAHGNDSGMINIFAARYLADNPGRKLAPLFAKSDNVITADMPDNTVIASLNKQAAEAMQYEARSLEQRARSVTGNMGEAKVDSTGRLIVLQVHGDFFEPQLRTVLETRGDVGFYEVYSNNEIGPLLSGINDRLVALLPEAERAVDEDASGQRQAPAQGSSSDLRNAIQQHEDSLGKEFAKIKKENNEKMKRYPLFRALTPNVSGNADFAVGPVVGFVSPGDTARLNRYLRMPEVKTMLPPDARFLYGVPDGSSAAKGGGRKAHSLELYAIKMPARGALITGDAITKAKAQKDRIGLNCIDIDLDKRGSQVWADMTGRNIGSYIAIVFDGVVYSCPRVENAITGGKTEICGSYTKETAGNLTHILTAGKLPLPARVLSIVRNDSKR